MSIFVFGHTRGGQPVRMIDLSSGGLSVRVMEWGATLLDLRLDGVSHPLTVGFKDFATYEAHGQHVGAIAGRFAGRIAGGFSIGDRRYNTTQNNGSATLHGGANGLGVSLWSVHDFGDDFVDLVARQPAGADGFPGAIEAHCRYELAQDQLCLRLSATSDAPTICNLAQHSYFNLSGAPDINDHALTLAADHYTPLDAALLPTGEVLICDEARDYRTQRQIGSAQLDGHFVLARTRRAEPAFVATLSGGGVEMDVATTEPGLVVYTADKFPVTNGGLLPHPYGSRAGICLECQLWPDAPNQPGFPSAYLAPDEPYCQETRYRFRCL